LKKGCFYIMKNEELRMKNAVFVQETTFFALEKGCF